MDVIEDGRDAILWLMAASMYIVVEGEDPGFDIFVNGRALARYEDALERVALRIGVKPLIEFFSADENSMSLLIEEGAGNPELIRRLPPPQWYSPADGLTTVRALLSALEDNPQQLGTEGPQVLSELQEYARVLEKANDAGHRWHIAVSWR
jgi:hypothetical protein